MALAGGLTEAAGVLMGDTRQDAIEKARSTVAKLVDRTAKLALHSLDRPDDEVKTAMELPPAEAPLYAHLLRDLAKTLVKGETTQPAVNNTLNVVIPGRSVDTASWALEAAEFQARQIAERRKVIEAAAVTAPSPVEASK